MPTFKAPSFSRSPFQQNPISPIDTRAAHPTIHENRVSPNGRSGALHDPFTEHSFLRIPWQGAREQTNPHASARPTYFSGCSPIEESSPWSCPADRSDQGRLSLPSAGPMLSRVDEKPLPTTPIDPSSVTVSPIAEEPASRDVHNAGIDGSRDPSKPPPLPPPPTWCLSPKEGDIEERDTRGESAETLTREVTRKSGFRVGEQEVSQKPTIKHWPTEPQYLHSRSAFSILYTIGDVILTAIPLAFLVLCGLAARLNERPTENNQLGENIVKFSRLGPTIFPIVFAAVAGRTMKVIARFCAERGARLGMLEMLMASQTVWGAFESQLLLRRFGFVGAHLLILWSLSPVGGQASLYLLDRTTAFSNTTVPLVYMDTGPAAILYSALTIGASGGVPINMNSLYASSLLAPDRFRNGLRDTWGNIKIPRFEVLTNEIPDIDGWLKVPPLSSADNYTSMLGLPVVGLGLGSSSFKMESSYWSIACQNPVVQDGQNPKWLDDLGYVWRPYMNFSAPLGLFNMQDFEGSPRYASFILDTTTVEGNNARISIGNGAAGNATELSDPELYLTRYITLASLVGSETSYPVVLFNCSIIQPHVESLVECPSDKECVVTKMRKSLQDKRPEVLTPLDNIAVASQLFTRFPVALGAQQAGTSSATEVFLRNTTISPFADMSLDEQQFIDLSKVRPDLIGPRLALVLNTYFQSSLAPFAFTADLPTNLTIYAPIEDFSQLSDQNPGGAQSAPMVSRNATASVSHELEVYVVRYGWLAVFIVTSTVLFLVGITGLVFKAFTNAPDMLGYATSLTYDNPRIALPAGGGPLDGMERARALKDLKIRIVDVRGDEDIGHVALISAEPRQNLQRGETGKIRKLERSRRYL